LVMDAWARRLFRWAEKIVFGKKSVTKE